MARLPASHHAFAVFAEVCYLAGGSQEGVSAQLQTTGGGRGGGAAGDSGSPLASPRGDVADKYVALPAAEATVEGHPDNAAGIA